MSKEKEMALEYYMRNKHAAFLGNSPVWWAKDGRGYTAYIQGAHRFPENEAKEHVRREPDKWEIFKCEDVDARLHLVFDYQDKERLGTDAPCGWNWGYALTQPSQTQARAALIDQIRSKFFECSRFKITDDQFLDFLDELEKQPDKCLEILKDE